MALCAVMVKEDGHYLHRPAREGDQMCWPGTSVAMVPLDLPDTWAWDHLTGVPGAFPPLPHTHVKSDITDFAHTHSQSDVVGLVTTLAGKSDVGHTHPGLPVYAFATGDQTTTGATGVNITGLSFAVAANTRYMGTLQFLYQSNNILAGPAIGATGPAMSEAFTATVHAPGSTSLGGLIANVGGLLSLTTTDQVNVDRPLTVHFKFRVGGSGGTLQFQFGRGGLVGSQITSRASSTAQLFQAA